MFLEGTSDGWSRHNTFLNISGILCEEPSITGDFLTTLVLQCEALMWIASLESQMNKR